MDRVVAACGGDRPEEVLDRLAEPAAVHLLDDRLRSIGRGPLWRLMASDGPDGVRFSQDLMMDYLLAQDGGADVISVRRERTNDLRGVARFTDLDEARAALAHLLS